MERDSGELKEEFKQLLVKTRKHAKENNLIEKDMWDAIKKARKNNYK